MARFYQKIFAAKYDQFMNGIEEELSSLRRELISDLKGNILEIGAGTGINFQFYTPEAKVTAIEPSEFMLAKAKPKVGTKNINIIQTGVGEKEHDDLFDENQFDAIVCTLVLCTIPNPERALHQFKKWLKPTGKLLVMEHIKSEKKFNGVLQGIANPVWKVIGDGCNLNRNTDQLIKNAGFRPLKDGYFKRTLRFYTGEFVLSRL